MIHLPQEVEQDFGVVGAHPAGQCWDMNYERANIKKVGRQGPASRGGKNFALAGRELVIYNPRLRCWSS